MSYKIVKRLSDFFPNSNHVTSLGLTNASDYEIWKYAKENDFTIVTFDIDFFELSNLEGHPTKAIWHRCFNSRTEKISTILIENYASIKTFIESTEFVTLSCLVLK